MKKYITLALWLCAAVTQAANIAVGPSATGNGLGGDWNNLMSWSGTLVRGNTYYLVDAETYGGRTLNTPVSGTTLITVKKATVADHGGITTGWSNALGDGRALFTSPVNISTSYWVFDGVTGGGPGQWTTNFGFKIAATSLSHGPPINLGSIPIGNITIRHVDLQGHGPDDGTGAPNQDCIAGDNISNVTVSYVYGHDTGRCIFFATHGSNWIFEYCYTGKYESTAAQHSEGLQFDGASNYTVRWCLFRYSLSTGLIIMHGNDIKIYGNVFYPDPALGAWTTGNGVIGGWSASLGNNITNSVVYNNTFVNVDAGIFGGTSAASGNIARNNYFYNCPASGISGTWNTQSHNHWQSSSSPTGSNTTTGSGDPFAGGSVAALEFRLAANTTPGFSLPAPFNVDMHGATRTSWTRGAVEFSGSDTTPPVLTGDLVTVDGTGLTWTFTFSEAIRVGTGGFGGWLPNMTGGAVTLSGFSIVGNVLTATGSRALDGGETGTIAYTQPGNGIEDLAFNDFATFSGADVDNNAVVNAVLTPTIDLASGYYYSTQIATLTCDTPGATIRYTLDGTDPTTSSPVYSTPLTLSTGVTLKTFATKSGMGNSLVESAVYQIGAWTSDSLWHTFPVPTQTGTFVWQFSAMPTDGVTNTHFMVSSIPVANFTDGAVIVEFDYLTGTINARDGNTDTYHADNTLAFTDGVWYDFFVTINDTANTFSVIVTPSGGSPTIIATDYAFRDEQIAGTALDNFGTITTVGSTTDIANMTFGPLITPPPVTTPAATNLIISDP